MNSAANDEHRSSRFTACAEIALIVTLFFVLAGTPPPDVNEAHYVVKAKHYWNPEWCATDHFLNSADAHLMFYWAFGWLTLFFDLPTVTWIGRFITWLLLAWSWRRLSIAIIPVPLYSVLTAALFATLMRWGHMAGEWVIGGLEAKGFAYVLIWLALEAVLRNRWRHAIVMLGAASAFHVIAGGWAFVAVAFAWGITDRQLRPTLLSLVPSLLVSGVFALAGLVPGLALSWSTSPEIVREANRIYVFERLSHHLLFHDLPHIYIARHAALLVAWLGLWYRFKGDNSELAKSLPESGYPEELAKCFKGKSSELAKSKSQNLLSKIVLGAVAIALAGIVLDQSLLYFRALAASILRYYWFRLSDVMLPVGVTFGLACWLQQLRQRESKEHGWLFAAVTIVLSVSVSHVVYEHLYDPRPGAVSQSLPGEDMTREGRMLRFGSWTRVCYWIYENTPADSVFLTPRHQQTFHWYAGRSEVVSAKNFPQDAEGIVQWRQRLDDVFPRSIDQANLSAQGEQRLVELAQKYSFQYIVLDRAVSPRRLRFPRIYPTSDDPSSYYEVYRVPPAGGR